MIKVILRLINKSFCMILCSDSMFSAGIVTHTYIYCIHITLLYIWDYHFNNWIYYIHTNKYVVLKIRNETSNIIFECLKYLFPKEHSHIMLEREIKVFLNVSPKISCVNKNGNVLVSENIHKWYHSASKRIVDITFYAF